MADRLAGGRLADVLATQKAELRSWEAVSRHLHAEFGIEVTSETLRRWGIELGIKRPAAEAS